MPIRIVKPTNETGVAAGKGRLTWVALGGIVVFIAFIIACVAVPLHERYDGPETGIPVVNQAAMGPSSATPSSSDPGSP